MKYLYNSNIMDNVQISCWYYACRNKMIPTFEHYKTILNGFEGETLSYFVAEEFPNQFYSIEKEKNQDNAWLINLIRVNENLTIEKEIILWEGQHH